MVFSFSFFQVLVLSLVVVSKAAVNQPANIRAPREMLQGTRANLQKYPWVVHLRVQYRFQVGPNINTRIERCTGTIIDDRGSVITTGSCVPKRIPHGSSSFWSLYQVSVLWGTLDLLHHSDNQREEVLYSSGRILHERPIPDKSNPRTSETNVVLIYLSKIGSGRGSRNIKPLKVQNYYNNSMVPASGTIAYFLKEQPNHLNFYEMKLRYQKQEHNEGVITPTFYTTAENVPPAERNEHLEYPEIAGAPYMVMRGTKLRFRGIAAVISKQEDKDHSEPYVRVTDLLDEKRSKWIKDRLNERHNQTGRK